MGSFSDDVIEKAWARSGSRCECTRTSHSWHTWGRCPQNLVKANRGKDVPTGWEAHHKVAQEKGGPDTLSNCEILCQRCHKATLTFGG